MLKGEVEVFVMGDGDGVSGGACWGVARGCRGWLYFFSFFFYYCFCSALICFALLVFRGWLRRERLLLWSLRAGGIFRILDNAYTWVRIFLAP